jgi:4-hydroxybenzoate polyprenyltransferase
MGATTVFALCFLTSLACAVLLWRGYRASRAKLLLWSSLCFFGLALNNALLILDTNSPDLDMSVIRTIPILLGLAALLYGLVWESE